MLGHAPLSRIFISHSSRDNAVAAEVRERLEERGHRSIFLDFDPEDGIPAGRSWERELYRQLRACRAAIVLCSEHSMSSRWCFAEITHAKSLGKALFPIKIGPCEVDPTLTDRQILDLTQDRETVFEGLFRGLEIAGLDPASASDWDGSRPPFPGLLAFQREDAAVFFGRDPEIQQGLEKLQRLRRFGGARGLMVVGASGSGKSSLVRAGLLPRLSMDPDQWLAVDPFRPRADPLRQLALRLAAAFDRYGESRGWRELLRSLRAAAAPGRGAAVRDLAQDLRLAAGRLDASVLLTVDQTEELLGAGGAQADRFWRLLRAALDAPDSPLLAVLTLRSDFYSALQQHRVARRLELEDLRVGPLSKGRFAEVIAGPAELASLRLGPGLTETMVADTETEDALPLLAFSLRELYDRYAEDGHLEVEDYRLLGGLSGSVARAAREVFAAARLSEADEDDLRRAFLRLARVDEEGHVARRAARWRDLPASVHPLLERLVQARLLVARDDDGERLLEVAHEALFRSWDRLARWLEAGAEALRLARDVRIAAGGWHRHGRSEDHLWRGARLGLARELRASGDLPLAELGEAFVEASEAAERARVEAEQTRRRRILQAVVGVAAAIGILAVVAVFFGLEARREALAARDRARIAVASEWLSRDPTRAALVLLELEEPAAAPFAVQRLFDVLEQPFTQVALGKHAADVYDASFSRDGTRVVTASIDRTARIWNVATGEPIGTLPHPDEVHSASFDAGGTRVVTASRDKIARIWSVDSGAVLAALAGHTDQVVSASFSPDGKWVVTASADKTALIWEVASGAEIASFTAHTDMVNSAAFSADGKRVVTASADGTARVWSAATGEPVGEPLRDDGEVTSASFDASGSRVVTASGIGSVTVWKLAEGGAGMLLLDQTQYFDAASFSADGKRVVTASRDGTAKIWDVVQSVINQTHISDQPMAKLAGHEERIFTASFSADGTQVVTASRDGTARVWEAKAREVSTVLAPQSEVVSASFSADGTRVVTASRDGAARFWDAASGAEIRRFEGHGQSLDAACLSPDGEWLVTAASDATARLWNAATGKEVKRLAGHGGRVTDASFSADSARLVTASDDRIARVWDTSTWRVVATITGHTDRLTAASFSPDGTRVVTASWDATARIWDARTGEPVGPPLEHGDAVNGASFSSAGTRVVTASDDRTARLWDVPPGREAIALKHPVEVTSASFSADGGHVVTGTQDGTVRIWDARSGSELATIEGHGSRIRSVAFSADGTRVVTASEDRTARIWPVTGERLAALVRERTALCLDADFRREALDEDRAQAGKRFEACSACVADFRRRPPEISLGTAFRDYRRCLRDRGW